MLLRHDTAHAPEQANKTQVGREGIDLSAPFAKPQRRLSAVQEGIRKPLPVIQEPAAKRGNELLPLIVLMKAHPDPWADVSCGKTLFYWKRVPRKGPGEGTVCEKKPACLSLPAGDQQPLSGRLSCGGRP